MCNFGRGYQEEQFCEIILEFGSVVEKMSFKRFLIWSSGDPPVQWSRTIYAILNEGIMGNIHVKLYGSGEMSFKEKVYRQTKTDHNTSP